MYDYWLALKQIFIVKLLFTTSDTEDSLFDPRFNKIEIFNFSNIISISNNYEEKCNVLFSIRNLNN